MKWIADDSFLLALNNLELDREIYDHEVTGEFEPSFIKVSTIAPIFMKTNLNRNKLLTYPEDANNRGVQIATRASELSLLFKEDIFIFHRSPYLVKLYTFMFKSYP